jgi:hypothetical protein
VEGKIITFQLFLILHFHGKVWFYPSTLLPPNKLILPNFNINMTYYERNKENVKEYHEKNRDKSKQHDQENKHNFSLYNRNYYF